jgi:hypothetical protein
VGLDFDFRHLWKGLDQDDNADIDLHELSASRGRTLAKFKQWVLCHPKLQSCAGVWDSKQAASIRGRRRSGRWTGDSAHKMRFNRTADVLRSLGWPEAGDKEERVRLLTSLDSWLRFHHSRRPCLARRLRGTRVDLRRARFSGMGAVEGASSKCVRPPSDGLAEVP